MIFKESKVIKPIFFLLAIGFIFRLALAPYGTLWVDMNSWIGWGNQLISVNWKSFYQTWCDYLPSYLYVLWFLSIVKGSILSLLPGEVIFKLPSILADLATAYLIYIIVRTTAKKKYALAAAAIYVFNPAVWVNSTLWGQADSFFTFFLLFSFWLWQQKKDWLSGMTLSFGSLLKPLGFLLLPLAILDIIKTKKLRQLLWFLAAFSIVFVGLFLPFSNGNFFSFVVARFNQTLNQYTYTSLNAFNLWGALGRMWQTDNIGFWNYQKIGDLLFGGFYLILLYQFYKKKLSVFKKSLLISLVFYAAFLFLTRMHERHLFPVFAFLNISAFFSPAIWPAYFLASLIYVLDLIYAHLIISSQKAIFSQGLIQFLSTLQLFNFLFLMGIFFGKLKPRIRKLDFLSQISVKKDQKADFGISNKLENSGKRYPVVLIMILFFAFLTRIYNLWYPETYIFDEVYHAFTAQEIIKGNIAAWEWWNTPPEGFAYEWTHPPIAKIIMAGGIIAGRAFGVSNDFFSWRLPAALFGTGVVFLVYLLAKKLFNSEKIALLSAFFISCEGLTLVMSRIGMSDIYFLFFMLLSLILALDKKWLLTGLVWGLALATKWTGLYLGLPLFLIFSWQNIRKPAGFYRWLGVMLLPVAVYLLSYCLFFTSGHSIKQFWELQNQMWGYHTGLKATHNYQSSAYSWPLDLRPVWFYVNYQSNGVGNIYALGNPIIFWLGLIALPAFVYETWEKKSKKYLLVLLLYFIFWIPWIASPRIMFLYHYLPSVPFLTMILAWLVVSLSSLTNSKLVLWGITVLIILSFLFFYPLWTGIVVPQKITEYFFWLPTWK